MPRSTPSTPAPAPLSSRSRRRLHSPGLTGNNSTSGPNGVTTGVRSGQDCLFAGDGDSRVVSFALPAGTQVGNLSTGGSFRADEMAFDSKDGVLIVANNADSPPFATLIGVGAKCGMVINKKIVFSFATNGAEQPVWDPTTDLFYQSIPSTSGTTAAPGPTGAIAVINPTSGAITQMFAGQLLPASRPRSGSEPDVPGRLQRRLRYRRHCCGSAPTPTPPTRCR